MTEELERGYCERFEAILQPVAKRLEAHIQDHLIGVKRIDRVTARAKSPDRFLAKAAKLVDGKQLKYDDPLTQIQDQIGARIVVLYQSDIQAASKVVEKYYFKYEQQTVIPDTHWKFGYFGLHYILKLPPDVVPGESAVEEAPQSFELQIKTLWQHAWSEANHDLGYKPVEELTPDQQRRLAYTSAQAWGADRIFEELFHEIVA